VGHFKKKFWIEDQPCLGLKDRTTLRAPII